MDQSEDRLQSLLASYRPFILQIVGDFGKRNRWQMDNYHDDLISEAYLVFIRHLQKIDDERSVTACKKDIYKALAAFCRSIAPIHIAGTNFREKLDSFQFVPLDSLQYCLTTPADSISALTEMHDFMRTLEPDELTALKMHLSGCTYAEILPHVHGRGKAYVCRLLQSVQRKAAMYCACRRADHGP